MSRASEFNEKEFVPGYDFSCATRDEALALHGEAWGVVTFQAYTLLGLKNIRATCMGNGVILGEDSNYPDPLLSGFYILYLTNIEKVIERLQIYFNGITNVRYNAQS